MSLNVAYISIIFSVLFAAAGQLLLKSGAYDSNTIVKLFNIRVAFGLLIYLAGAVLWIISLTRLPLKTAYPFTALTFVLVYFGASFFFGESINKLDILGAFFILSGLFILIFSST